MRIWEKGEEQKGVPFAGEQEGRTVETGSFCPGGWVTRDGADHINGEECGERGGRTGEVE